MKFRIRLKHLHDKKGATFYRVSVDTGLSHNTVRKYADVEYVDSPWIPVAVVTLAKYYGVDWRSSEVVEVIEDTE